jgi:hypothetical protein
MTEHRTLLEKGRSGEPGIVPGHPEKSRVMQLIVPQEGKPPAMPRNQDPLTPSEQWKLSDNGSLREPGMTHRRRHARHW